MSNATVERRSVQGTPSESANIQGGFNHTNEYLRSLLIHPFGIPLAAYLNDVDVDNDANLKNLQASLKQDYIDTLREIPNTNTERLSSCLQTALNEWESDNEHDLRMNIWNELNDDEERPLETSTSLAVETEKYLTEVEEDEDEGTKPIKGRVDFVFTENTPPHEAPTPGTCTTIATNNAQQQEKKSVVALVELGIGGVDDWWRKHDQNLIYANLLANNVQEGYKLDRPTLLITVTVSKRNNDDADDDVNREEQDNDTVLHEQNDDDVVHQKKRARLYDDKNDSRTNNNNNNNNNANSAGNNTNCIYRNSDIDNEIANLRFVANFGVFLCIPHKENKSIRISLLFRTQTKTIGDTSNQFAKIIVAADICAKLREKNINVYEFEYFGPNCCKFGDKVFRSYDNRLRTTARRPDVYLSEEVFGNEKATVIFDIKDESTKKIVDFGIIVDEEKKEKKARLRLWKFCGKLLIIATPYREGDHYVTHPAQFVPIIEALEQLHMKGFVHGDIRAYNMVHGKYIETEQCQGWLIDYDFGGKACAVTYPNGYKSELADGGSERGIETYPITIADDWSSLYSLIKELYHWEFPKRNNTEKSQVEFERDEEHRFRQVSDAVIASLDVVEGIHGQAAEHVRNPLIVNISNGMKAFISHLVEFNYTPKLKKKFKRDLIMNNFIILEEAAVRKTKLNTKSAAATYSPDNK